MAIINYMLSVHTPRTSFFLNCLVHRYSIQYTKSLYFCISGDKLMYIAKTLVLGTPLNSTTPDRCSINKPSRCGSSTIFFIKLAGFLLSAACCQYLHDILVVCEPSQSLIFLTCKPWPLALFVPRIVLAMWNFN